MTGCVHIYTGDGKGKTTAAVGLLTRASGAGLRCLMVQFVKGIPSGEVRALTQLGCPVWRAEETGSKFIWNMDDSERAVYAEKQLKLFHRAGQALLSGDYDLVVLDELMGMLHSKFIGFTQVEALLDGKPDGVELVMTGRSAPDALISRADYVTEMLPVKHPMEKGIKARKGIEY